MGKVRIGVVGIGNMGQSHANYLSKGEVQGAELTAVFDLVEERLQAAKENWGEQLQTFNDLDAFLQSGAIDAILIATPHYSHAEIAIKAFKQGLHVLCEKPAGVYTKQVREMNEAAAASGKIFSMMYNQRTNPLYQKLRELIQTGELGEIRRINWIITDWYRPQSYYDSGAWRATWAGEGGGVLINQCPHQLDLWQWISGMMPERIRAFCRFGRYRDIEVEDDVTAYAEYENGASAVFITTTGEAPGTNRLEITGDRGKVVVENGKLDFWRLRVPEPEFNRTYKLPRIARPEAWKCEVPIQGKNTGHRGITQNFVDVIQGKGELIAPGEEGINGLMISNAIHLSAWTDDWVNFPIDEDLYLKLLQERIDQSAKNKEAKETVSG